MVLHTPSGARLRSERPLTIARAPPRPSGARLLTDSLRNSCFMVWPTTNRPSCHVATSTVVVVTMAVYMHEAPGAIELDATDELSLLCLAHTGTDGPQPTISHNCGPRLAIRRLALEAPPARTPHRPRATPLLASRMLLFGDEAVV